MTIKSPAVEKESIPSEIKVLIGAAFVIAIGFGIIAPILPQYASSFDVTTAAAAFIVSVFALTRLLFAPLSGRLTEKLGEPIVYVGGVLIVAFSTILVGLAPNYELLLLFRALGGIGSTMFTVSAMALIARLAPPTIRGRISGLYAGAFLMGNIAGPVVGGLLATFGHRLPFFIYGGALVIAAALVHFSLARVRRRALASGQDDAGDARPTGLSVSEALASPTYRAALVSGFANGWTNFGVRVAIVPLFAVYAFGQYGTAIAGISLALFAAGNAVTLTFSGRLTDRYGRRWPVIIGLTVGSISMGFLGLAESVPLFIVLSVVAGAGIGVMNPAQQAAVADVVGQGRNGGRVLATFQMCTDFGAILGPVVAGLLVDQIGYGWAFAVGGLLGMLGVAAWARVPRPSEDPVVAEDRKQS
ncbi:MFS transporter [Zhihengliuella halotolerans]|uniref:Putative MFS family arabinose efflux permease n=1 Tax=Zhihengliuella halotolerans TaxID=370736 RepID=A0A4Q8ABJ7_9MICC|nr:MFS transporter [Zhihengliuella halotolerans]RZU61540.1 putative MFS family arabinose efflux permease [Zhihengliuella halotolerans]